MEAGGGIICCPCYFSLLGVCCCSELAQILPEIVGMDTSYYQTVENCCQNSRRFETKGGRWRLRPWKYDERKGVIFDEASYSQFEDLVKEESAVRGIVFENTNRKQKLAVFSMVCVFRTRWWLWVSVGWLTSLFTLQRPKRNIFAKFSKKKTGSKLIVFGA